MSRAVLALLVALVLAAAGCGGGGRDGAGRDATSTPERVRPATAPVDRSALVAATPGVRQRVLGRGAGTVTILEPTGQAAGPRPLVVFLHGWGALSPAFYGPWLVHLVRTGQTVVYPRYQASILEDPTRVLGTTVAALRRAFRVAPPATGSLVLAGHSAGGALSADVAALAPSLGLPRPVGVFAAYPGRRLRGVAAGIPAVGLAGLTRGRVQVEALGSERDDTVGTAEAHRIGRLGTYVAVTDPRVGEHRAPLQTDAAARRTFWARLDALIARARARR